MVNKQRVILWFVGLLITAAGTYVLIAPTAHGTRASRTEVRLNWAKKAAGIYRERYGKFPTNATDLTSILTNETISMRAVSVHWFDGKGHILDEWGRPIRVKLDSEGNGVRIYSCGKDGIDDGGKSNDDIARVWKARRD